MKHMKYHFDDQRINVRAEHCFNELMKNPGCEFPKLFKDPSELEGFYRLLKNPRSYLDSFKESTIVDTRTRIAKGTREILAIHDTTEIHPSKSSSIESFSDDGKFLAHVTLLADAFSPGYVYGVGDVSMWNRHRGYEPEVIDDDRKLNELDRWWDQVVRVNAEWGVDNLIHIMDREGDASKIWSRLVESGCHFVVRICHDRKVKTSDGEINKIFETMKSLPVVAHKSVKINVRKHPYKAPPIKKKRHPEREARDATLAITSQQVSFYKTNTHNRSTAESVVMNVVYVREKGAVEDLVEWCLITSEPIKTKNDVLRVVEFYHSRWIIEEFFKGLKTGCSLEDRMFASEGGWYRLVLFLMPAVTRIINLRYQLNHQKDQRHIIDLTETQWKILKKLGQKKSRKVVTIDEAYNEICRLGGHIKSNGAPGWKVILRGYLSLVEYEKAWLLMQEDVISP